MAVCLSDMITDLLSKDNDTCHLNKTIDKQIVCGRPKIEGLEFILSGFFIGTSEFKNFERIFFFYLVLYCFLMFL